MSPSAKLNTKMTSVSGLIFMQISDFHKNGFALRLALKQRYKGTQKRPISIHTWKGLERGEVK